MNYRYVIGTVLMLGAAGNFAADDISEDDTVNTEKTSSGVILEYEQESSEQAEQAENEVQDSPDADAGKSVEFIVGGQAEDGVAKRRKINVKK